MVKWRQSARPTAFRTNLVWAKQGDQSIPDRDATALVADLTANRPPRANLWCQFAHLVPPSGGGARRGEYVRLTVSDQSDQRQMPLSRFISRRHGDCHAPSCIIEHVSILPTYTSIVAGNRP